MAHSEVVLSSSPAQLALLDLQSGRTLINYKSAESSSSASSASALDTSTRLVGQPRKLTTCVLGQNGLGGAVATYGGPGKGSIRYGTFASEAVTKHPMPTVLSCLAMSPNGAFLAAGTPDQRVLLWNAQTGHMVAEFEPHYQGLTALAWSPDSQALITASKDAQAKVFALSSLLEESHSRPRHYCVLNDHTGAITDITASTGQFPHVRILSSSTDGTVKLWNLADPVQPLMATWSLPASAHAHLVAWPKLENCFFVAYKMQAPTSSTSSSDSQTTQSFIRRIDFYRLGQDEAGHASYDLAPAVSGSAELLNHPAQDEHVHVSSEDITAMHLSSLSSTLLVGTSSGQIRVLALPSLQVTRTINPSASLSGLRPGSNPITFLQSFITPREVKDKATLGSKGAAAAAASGEHIQHRALEKPAPTLTRESSLASAQGTSHQWMSPRSNRDVEDAFLPRSERKRRQSQSASSSSISSSHLSLAVSPTSPSQATDASPGDYAKLQAENAELKQQLARAVELSEQLWKSSMEKTFS